MGRSRIGLDENRTLLCSPSKKHHERQRVGDLSRFRPGIITGDPRAEKLVRELREQRLRLDREVAAA